MGDFNSDIYNKTAFDSTLKNMIVKQNLLCIDYLYMQNCDHTYQIKNKKSHIDHIII